MRKRFDYIDATYLKILFFGFIRLWARERVYYKDAAHLNMLKVSTYPRYFVPVSKGAEENNAQFLTSLIGCDGADLNLLI